MSVVLDISPLSLCLCLSRSLTLRPCWLHSGLGGLQLLPWPSACVRRCLSDVFWDTAKSMTSSTPPLPDFFSSAFRLSKSVVTEIVTLHRPSSVHYCTVYNKKSLITEHETGGSLFLHCWTYSRPQTFWSNEDVTETSLISTGLSGDVCVSPYHTLTH